MCLNFEAEMRPFLLIAALLLCCNLVRSQELARPGDFPYLVRLRVSSGFAWNTFSKDKYCSGILTVATCVKYWKTPEVEIITGNCYTRVVTADKVVDRYEENVRHNAALLWLKNGISGDYRPADFAEHRPNDMMAPKLGSKGAEYSDGTASNRGTNPGIHEQLPVAGQQQRIRLAKMHQPPAVGSEVCFGRGRHQRTY